MGFLVTWAWRNGLRKGILGGSRAWFVVAVASGALQLVKRLKERDDRERLGVTLEPGERVELALIEPGRARRRRS